MKWVLIGFAVLAAIVAAITIAGLLIPREHRATSSVVLRQPPDSVWRVVRDLGGVPSWWPEITQSERLPDQNGRETWRQKMSGFDMPLAVLVSEPPRRLVTEIAAGSEAAFGGTWTYELAPDTAGTRISITEAGWVSNPIFRFMSRVVFGYHATLDGYLKHLGKRFGEEVESVHS